MFWKSKLEKRVDELERTVAVLLLQDMSKDLDKLAKMFQNFEEVAKYGYKKDGTPKKKPGKKKVNK